MNFFTELHLVVVVCCQVSLSDQHARLGHGYILPSTLVEIPNQALGEGHEVLTAVSHGVISLGPLEQPGKTGPFGHTCVHYGVVQCVLPSPMALSRAGMKALRVLWSMSRFMYMTGPDTSENWPPLVI